MRGGIQMVHKNPDGEGKNSRHGMGFGVTIHERRTHPCVRTGQWGERLSYSVGAVGVAETTNYSS